MPSLPQLRQPKHFTSLFFSVFRQFISMRKATFHSQLFNDVQERSLPTKEQQQHYRPSFESPLLQRKRSILTAITTDRTLHPYSSVFATSFHRSHANRNALIRLKLSPDPNSWNNTNLLSTEGTLFPIAITLLTIFLKSFSHSEERRKVSFAQSIIAPSTFIQSKEESLHHNQTDTSTTIFSDWEDISQAENYVWYNTKLRQRKQSAMTRSSLSNTNPKTEQRWVFVSLLMFFTPIFTFEFFLTVSRQILCMVSHTSCLPYQ